MMWTAPPTPTASRKEGTICVIVVSAMPKIAIIASAQIIARPETTSGSTTAARRRKTAASTSAMVASASPVKRAMSAAMTRIMRSTLPGTPAV
jgi:hypothetical protein